MDRATLTRALKDRALELGFQKVGISPAAALEKEGERLEEWLDRGFHGSMAWMARSTDKRRDPDLHLPGVASIVSVAMNYYTPNRHTGSSGTGKVSRYAWGDDYHEIVGDRLRELQAWLRAEAPGVSTKIAVDTSPVMDKVWAVRAGLGWIGKHTNLITTEFGSWVFLGELLCSIELDYDNRAVPDQCGSCTACIDACPTDAITEPYVVDSNRCISYLTIELRDKLIPLSTQGWVYGCDICQDVCPWNRFQQPATQPGFEPRNGLVDLDLRDVEGMSQEEFSRRFRKSAMKRTKLAGLQRNGRAVGGSH